MRLDISVYGIVDPQIARGRPLAALARAAVDGGATLIQYRAKGEATRTMLREALAIRAALAGTGVPLLINDRIDVALAAGAEGVHLGNDDMPLPEARRLLGEKAIIGATLNRETALASLAETRIDYACAGAFFATSHKADAQAPLGAEGFAALRAQAARVLGPLPVGAIAGITAANAAQVIAAGADGVAVIGAIFAADDPAAAAAELRQAVAAARAAR
ncbi:thiamine phosphate synthase [Bosea sp. TWI1241]|uniref:thiamine phosphate synthase n=1 Tax=Bosea sp. TWI1241 TaxID=3148904 RepID=UPI00320A3CF2